MMPPPTPPDPARPLIAIAAVGANRVIGDGRRQPWFHKADLTRFVQLTAGHVLLMGRRTYAAIGRALPGRRTIVLTRNPNAKFLGAETATGIEEAIAAAQSAGPKLIFNCGGGEIYRLGWPYTARLELTLVARDLPGSVTFPSFSLAQWQLLNRDDHDDFAFATYVRRPTAS